MLGTDYPNDMDALTLYTWRPGEGVSDNNFWQAVGVMKGIEATLQKEISAGHYELNHMGYFWHQGCSNRVMDADDNILYQMGHIEAPKAEVIITILDKDGGENTITFTCNDATVAVKIN